MNHDLLDGAGDLADLFNNDLPPDPIRNYSKPWLACMHTLVLMLSLAVLLVTGVGWAIHQPAPQPKPATTGGPR